MLVTVVTMAIAVLFIFLVNAIARRRPNRSRKHPERVRVPLIVALLGWPVTIAGVVFTLVTFLSTKVEMSIGDKVTALLLLGFGWILLQTYFRWYLVVDYEFIERRGTFTRPKHIRYVDIESAKISYTSGKPVLMIGSTTGTKLSLNVAMFDVERLVQWEAFASRMGRAPSDAEIAFARQNERFPEDSEISYFTQTRHWPASNHT